MKRPLIGVTCWREHGSFGVWDRQMDFLEWAYVDAITTAGAWPVLIPPAPRIDPRLIERFDALVIAGGGDVAPARYGAEPHPAVDRVVPDRDEVEFTLAAAALERDMPLLGICRGHQVLAAVSGGTLVQHLSDEQREVHAPEETMFGDHDVELEAASALGRALGPRVAVKSHHHQAVATLGEGWTAVGWSADGTIEAMELEGAAFAVGVQWHPEWSGDPRIFQRLVEHAVRARSAGAGR